MSEGICRGIQANAAACNGILDLPWKLTLRSKRDPLNPNFEKIFGYVRLHHPDATLSISVYSHYRIVSEYFTQSFER